MSVQVTDKRGLAKSAEPPTPPPWWQALCDIDAERHAQIEKWGEQHYVDGSGHVYYANQAKSFQEINDRREASGNPRWALILLEEVYEALAEADPERLRAELIQVAAVAVSWTQDIDSRA